MAIILKEVLSADSEYKAEIRRRADGLLEVEIYRWTHEYVPDYDEVCGPFWEPISGPSLTDEFETAQQIAAGELKIYSREDDRERG